MKSIHDLNYFYKESWLEYNRTAVEALNRFLKNGRWIRVRRSSALFSSCFEKNENGSKTAGQNLNNCWVTITSALLQSGAKRHVLFWVFCAFSRSPATSDRPGRGFPRIRADVDPEGVWWAGGWEGGRTTIINGVTPGLLGQPNGFLLQRPVNFPSSDYDL